jgi:hypothetical protein
MATTTNYGWTTPNDSDPFKDGALAMRTLGNAIDSTVASLNQGDVSYVRNTTAILNLTTSTETSFMTSPSFTPKAGRLYEVTVTVGYHVKTTGSGNTTIRIRKDNVSGTVLDTFTFSAVPVNQYISYTRTVLLTSTQMGTTAFVPTITAQTNTNGYTIANDATQPGAIIIKDIGAA